MAMVAASFLAKGDAARAASGAVATLLLGACLTTGPSDQQYVQVEPRWVVGAAAEALGSDGRFDFSHSLPPVVGELSRDESLELARAAIRHIAVSVGGGREVIANEHGAPIEFARLAPCGRRIIPILANLADPGPAVPHYVRTPLGPSYLSEFCSESGRPTVSVQVYVRTLARVRTDGLIEFPNPGGTEFVAIGIPLRPLADLTPEFGARLVYERVGMRISAVPELDGCVFTLRICNDTQGRHWKFRIERPIRVRLASGSVVETSELYTQAGFGALDPWSVYVATEAQPEPTWEQYPLVVPGEPDGVDSVLLRVVRPLRLERFDLAN